jgi:hypothetical protein
MRRMVSTLVVAMLVAAGCVSSSSDTTTTVTMAPAPTTAVTTTSTTVPATTSTARSSPPAAIETVGRPDSGFNSTLSDVPLIIEGAYAGPAWPSSLNGVAFVDAVPGGLHERLVEDGFVIEPDADGYATESPEALAWSTQFSTIYEQLGPYGGAAGRPVFVTTDVGYHLWHQVFDFVLRDTEERQLLAVLESLVGGLLSAARDRAATFAGTPMEDTTVRATEHLEAVASVLELDVGPISERAEDEVALVEAHTEIAVSPTVGGSCEPPATASCVDYSLMTPRGHYTRSSGLTRYFKAMSMLGNIGFSVTDVETLRVGLVIAHLLVADPDLAAAWATIYDPTSFLVGMADDYTPFEAAGAAASVGVDLGDLSALTADEAVASVGNALLASRDVQIDPQRSSLRTMGSRFVLDSWIYDQLTDPGVAGRIRPDPLDLASVMGSDFADGVQSAAGEPAAYPDYEPKVVELRKDTAARPIDQWGETVYSGWLYALQPEWVMPHPDAYPPFMRTPAWEAKSHNTGFASYAELKHDTILYAKQGIAEGDAPEPPPPPRHWVEPDPVAFGRLAALARMMRDGLAGAGLMLAGDYDTEEGDPWNEDETTRWAADYLIDMLDRFTRLADDELAALPISADDNKWLSEIGGAIGWLLEAVNRGEIEATPIIADIFLDPFADEVLEVGTGPLETIHVIVPDDEGNFQVATGAVYSYYQFWGPRSERLTDEEWRDRIVTGDLPERPSWWTDELG